MGLTHVTVSLRSLSLQNSKYEADFLPDGVQPILLYPPQNSERLE